MTDETTMPGSGVDPSWFKQIAETINAMVPNAGNCLACGSAGIGKVVLGNQIVTPAFTDPVGGVTIGGQSMPQAVLICTNCGFTRYFNYMILQQRIADKGAGSEPK